MTLCHLYNKPDKRLATDSSSSNTLPHSKDTLVLCFLEAWNLEGQKSCKFQTSEASLSQHLQGRWQLGVRSHSRGHRSSYSTPAFSPLMVAPLPGD